MKARVISTLKDLSIGKKLLTIILTTNIIALFSASIIQILFIFYNERDFLEKRLRLTADIVALQTAVSLEFADPISARENLMSLRVYPAISIACIYDNSGNIFAAVSLLTRQEIGEDKLLCPLAGHYNTRLVWDMLYIHTDIMSGTHKVGTLYLEYDLFPLYQNMLRIVTVTLVIFLCSLLFSYIIASSLQRLISQPIISLAQATHQFTQTHDYTLRAVKYGEDELGWLADSFNVMIKELEKHELQLERVIKELSDSNVELERFAYICSHDLQEPLRMISNYTQLLSREYQDRLGDDAKDYMDFIIDGAGRMRHLINDILAYSRIGYNPGPISSVNVNEIVHNVLKNLEFAIQQKDAVITMDRLPVMEGYKTLMTQVFQNLISNALKFGTGKQPKVHIGARPIVHGWEFSVQDNGIGLNMQYRDKIFEIFKRLNRQEDYEGTGIGLAICKKAVEYHGGRIWVVSEPGKGSTFLFTIPDVKPSLFIKRGKTNNGMYSG